MNKILFYQYSLNKQDTGEKVGNVRHLYYQNLFVFLNLLLVLILLVFNTSVYAKDVVKTTYFVLQNFATFKNDITAIVNRDKYNLVLVVSEMRNATLKESERRAFDTIIVANPFNYEVVQQKVSELIYDRKLQKFDFLTHDEYSLAIVGKLRDEFNTGSPGFTEVNKFLTKTIMKEALNDKVRIPKYLFFDYQKYIQNKEQYLNQIAQVLEFPIFAKPVDNAGACNTSKILSKDELVKWAEEHKSSNNFELDEFVNGTLYHIDSLIFNNKIIFSQVAKYAYPCFDFLQGKPVASIVVPDLDSESIRMKNFNKQVIKAISPVPNGGTHLEVFKKSNGELVFVEIAARTPGALVPQMYEKYYGFKIEELHFKLQMGKVPSFNSDKKYYSAWVAYPMQEGIVTALHSPTVKSQYDIVWKIKVGDKLSNPIELKDSAITILLWNDNYDVLRKDFEYLTSTFKPFTVK